MTEYVGAELIALASLLNDLISIHYIHKTLSTIQLHSFHLAGHDALRGALGGKILSTCVPVRKHVKHVKGSCSRGDISDMCLAAVPVLFIARQSISY